MTAYRKLCDAENCRAPIVMLKDPQTGRAMPVDDNDKVVAGEEYYERGRHSPHWATCKDPNRFRRKRGPRARREDC